MVRKVLIMAIISFLIFDNKAAAFAKGVVSVQTSLKYTTHPLREFIVLSELIQRPLTRAASKGAPALTRAHASSSFSVRVEQEPTQAFVIKRKSSQRYALNKRRALFGQ